MAKLVLDGVRKVHPGASEPALASIDLQVDSGQVLVLVGPSGCGKSTALRLIAGLDSPDAGSISLDGRSLANVAPQDRDVAMVFQGYALYPHMTVRENIAFPLKMRGVDRATRNGEAARVAEVLGIGELLLRRPDELSGGERQRVAMGRALVRKPKLFLFDEPLSNLDAALRTSLRVEIARLLRQIEATAIYVTHDQIEAMTVGDSIAVMQRGTIEQRGAPREVYEAPQTVFVAGFLGSPSMNLIQAVASGDHALVFDCSVALPLGVSMKGPITLGIRPDRFAVRPPEEEADQSCVSIRARVAAAEPLGAETIVHCEVLDGSAVLRAVAPGFFEASVGETVQLVAPATSLLWFDAKSGARVVGRSR